MATLSWNPRGWAALSARRRNYVGGLQGSIRTKMIGFEFWMVLNLQSFGQVSVSEVSVSDGIREILSWHVRWTRWTWMSQCSGIAKLTRPSGQVWHSMAGSKETCSLMQMAKSDERLWCTCHRMPKCAPFWRSWVQATHDCSILALSSWQSTWT